MDFVKGIALHVAICNCTQRCVVIKVWLQMYLLEMFTDIVKVTKTTLKKKSDIHFYTLTQHICIYTCAHMLMLAHICIYVATFKFMRVCIHTYTHAVTHTQKCIYSHFCTHIYISISGHMSFHAHTNLLLSMGGYFVNMTRVS